MISQRGAAVRAARQFRASNLSRRNPIRFAGRASRRSYASAADTAKETAKNIKNSDLPWLITSVAITVPGTYLILANGSWGKDAGYPGQDWHGDHDEEHEEGDEEEGGEEGGKEDGEEGGDEEKAEKEGGEEGGEDGGDEEGESKGDSGKEETENEDGSKTVKYADAKGGVKRRVESGSGITLGNEGDSSSSSTTGKQAGLTNVDTKHSTDPGSDPEKSKKAEGVPDTAKTQGTVDPSRKAV